MSKPGTFSLSPTLLTTFIACPHAGRLELGPVPDRCGEPDANLLAELGARNEAADLGHRYGWGPPLRRILNLSVDSRSSYACHRSVTAPTPLKGSRAKQYVICDRDDSERPQADVLPQDRVDELVDALALSHAV